MKYSLFIISFFLFGPVYNACLSQQVFAFRYDSNGNRVSRTLVLEAPQLKSTANSDSLYHKEYKEVIDKLEIILYPNPTKGELKVELKNFQGQSPSSIALYDFTGHLLQNYQSLQESNIIDLSMLPRATYILRILADGKQTEWKVIKE